MLADDEGKDGELEGVGLALQHPEAVSSPVGVVGGEDDETLLGQAGSKGPIVAKASNVGPDHVLGKPLQTVLSHHHRAPFPGLKIFGNQQDSPGEDVGPDVEHHLVPRPLPGLPPPA